MNGMHTWFCTANCRGRQLGDPSGFAAGGRLISRPYRCGGNREPTATHEVHPLSFAFAQQLPKGGAKGRFAPAGGYEPPLRVRWKSELAGRKLATSTFCCKLPEKQPYFL